MLSESITLYLFKTCRWPPKYKANSYPAGLVERLARKLCCRYVHVGTREGAHSGVYSHPLVYHIIRHRVQLVVVSSISNGVAQRGRGRSEVRLPPRQEQILTHWVFCFSLGAPILGIPGKLYPRRERLVYALDRGLIECQVARGYLTWWFFFTIGNPVFSASRRINTR